MAENGNGNTSIRVLIVDINAARREALSENLNQEHFEVFVAQGEGDALLADAQQQFIEHYCHVVVIAPRLLKSHRPEGPLRH